MKFCSRVKTTITVLATSLTIQCVAANPGAGLGVEGEPPIELAPYAVRARPADSPNYHVLETSAATKTNTPLLNVPQSITVVSARQISDQQMLSLSDVVRYVPGVSAHQGENNRDQIIFRGNSSSADFFLNGVRDDVQYYRDLYNLSRVEILRGPNAMIFGRGAGGGLINRVLKEAEFDSVGEVSCLAGSFQARRATLDLNQAVSAHLAWRLNALAEDSGSFRNHVSLKRAAINPTATLAPNRETKAVVSYEHFHDERTADRGITSFQGRPVDVPIGTYYGNPDDSRVHAMVDLVTATIQREVGNLTVRNRTLYADYHRDYQNYVPGALTASQAQVTLTAYNNATARRNFFNQTDLIATTSLGTTSHTLLGGVEVGSQATNNFRNTGYFDNTATSLLVPAINPVTHVPVTFRQSATDADNHLRTNVVGVYAQDQMEFSPAVLAIVGIRFDSFQLHYRNNRNGDRLSRTDEIASPRAGLIYKPAAHASIYMNYSVSFLPSSGDQFSSLTNITQQVKPEKFTNYEVGAKWELTSSLEVTTAIYQLDRTNTRATDPLDPTRIVQTGSTRTDGVEFGVNGSLTRAWSVAGGYAYQDAVIRSATTAAWAGAQVAQVAHHELSLWNRYHVTPKFGIGLGVVCRSATFAAIDNTVFLPGYARIDAAIYYAPSPTYQLQANLENISDRKYFANADSNTNISPGSPRTLRVTMRVKF